MNSEDSKAMLEVWEWKNKAYEELLKIPEGEWANYVQKKNESLISELNLTVVIREPIKR